MRKEIGEIVQTEEVFRKDNEFYNIRGYDDIKDIVRRALDAEDNYNLLFETTHNKVIKTIAIPCMDDFLNY